MKVMLEYALGEEWEHSHHVPVEEGQYVLMVRDPRDSFASHWRLYLHDNPGTQVTQLEFVDMLLKGNMGSHQDWNIGWVPHTQALLDWVFPHRYEVQFVRYEWLYARPRYELGYALARFGRRDIPLERIQEAVRNTRGKRWDPSDLPVDDEMGKPGKGCCLEPATLAALIDYCGPLMVELDYLGETDGIGD